ncbi:hypothetical protein Micbo1qcDRAFT_206304 [Microdochium bolleyi]|uniref:Transcription factor domain-containing protein n=1 Tax=Microdochium bolleyi TaxID=196109 RepID=A0A136IX53_9PEZI|nr:hypothetical protein Micbo1qcDRAFT_206304 [Microdochium bolleyi]
MGPAFWLTPVPHDRKVPDDARTATSPPLSDDIQDDLANLCAWDASRWLGSEYLLIEDLTGDADADMRTTSTLSSRNSKSATGPGGPGGPGGPLAAACARRPDVPTEVPSFVGHLGVPQRVTGRTVSWEWAIAQMRSFPREWAQSGETIFIPRHLHGSAVRKPDSSMPSSERWPRVSAPSLPRATRAALGVASTYALTSEENRHVLFQMVNAEVLELMWLLSSNDGTASGGGASSSSPPLMEELGWLQALLIYEIIQLLCGGLEQRVMAEQQRDIALMAALRLLRRVQPSEASEGGNDDDDDDDDKIDQSIGSGGGHEWLVAESIRRTALMLFCLYTINDVARHGVCFCFDTLAQMPVAVDGDMLWQTGICETKLVTEAEHRQALSPSGRGGRHPARQQDRTVSYDEFSRQWLAAEPRRLGRFEEMLLVMCKGMDVVQAHSLPASRIL